MKIRPWISNWPFALALSIGSLWSQVGACKTHEHSDFAIEVDEDYRVDVSAFVADRKTSISGILAAKARGEFRSYDEFLSYLYDSDPDLFENYVLIHDSGSIQASSLEQPRVVMYGQGIFLAFETRAPRGPELEERVEVLEFDEDTLSFVPHELVFRAADTTHTENPQVCAACHGQDTKPLWIPYDFWPNVYGSGVGRLSTLAEKTAFEQLAIGSGSASGVLKYLKPSKQSRGRLIALEGFTQHVTQLNIFRMIRILQSQSADLRPLLPALIGMMARCGDVNGTQGRGPSRLSDFFPAGQEAYLASLVEATSKMREHRSEYRRYLKQRFDSNFAASRVIFDVDHERLADEADIVGAASYLLATAGIDMAELVMSQGQNLGFFATPSNFAWDFVTAAPLLDQNLFRILSPRRVHPLGDLEWLVPDCSKLAEKSRQALMSHPNATLTPVAWSAKGRASTIYGRCISCHVQNAPGASGNAPSIPFDQTSRLREWFAETPSHYQNIQSRLRTHGPQRMPPDGSLTNDERGAMLEVFRRIWESR